MGDRYLELVRGFPLRPLRGESDLSRATGIPQSTISQILSGRRRMGRRHMQAFAGFFGVGPAVFLGGD